jgi:hypothetical protein
VSRLVIRHVDDVPWQEAKAQMHGDRRVSARLKFMEMAPNRTVIYTKYDPGLIIERHGHSSDHVVFVLEGLLRVGDAECPPGTMVLLEHGATFGPLIAGSEGAMVLEFYTGDVTPVPADPEGYEQLLRDEGIVSVPSDIERRAAGNANQDDQHQ